MIATPNRQQDGSQPHDPDLDPATLLQRGGRSLRPWTLEDLFRLLIGDFAGVVLVAISWLEASGELTVRHELAWLRLGISGIGVAGFTNARWLLAGRRVVGLARTAILPDQMGPPTAEAPSTTAAGPMPGAAPDIELMVVGAGVSLYHRPDCPLVAGKQTAQLAGTGLAPCEACEP